MATSSGPSRSRRVVGPSIPSRSEREPAATIRPSAIATASTQPKPSDPARVAIRPSTTSEIALIGCRPGDRSRSAGDGVGPARKAARSAPTRPAPRPTARAIRALDGTSVPASIAPAAHPGRAAAGEGVARLPRPRKRPGWPGPLGPPPRWPGGRRRGAPARCSRTRSPRRPARPPRARRRRRGSGRPSRRSPRRSGSAGRGSSPGGPARRGPRGRSRTTRSPSTRPSRPGFRLRNVSRAVVWVFVTSSAGSIVPASTTTVPTSGQLRARGAADGVAQVRRTVVVRLGGVAHRAGHDDRLRAGHQEIEQEARLLDRVRALDHDDAVDRRVLGQPADGRRQVEQVLGREVAGRLEAAVDGDHVGDRLETGGPGQDRRAVEGRDRPAGDRIHDHADRAAVEDRGDPPAASPRP